MSKANPWSKKKKGVVIGLSVFFGLIVAAIAAFCIYYFVVLKFNEVRLPIEVKDSNYIDCESTRIPLDIEDVGTGIASLVSVKDLGRLYTTSDGQGLACKDGEYKLKAVASPLCDRGIFYDIPSNPVVMVVRDGQITNYEDCRIILTKADMSKVTDEQINYAAEVARGCPDKESVVDKYVKKTKEVRDAAKGINITVTQDGSEQVTLTGTIKVVEYPHAQQMMEFRHIILSSPIKITYNGVTKEVTELEVGGSPYTSMSDGQSVTITGKIYPGNLDYSHSAEFIIEAG